jgi:Xaa-Pro dipeptidase
MSYKEAARNDIGFMNVDWQERIDFKRMVKERQAKVREGIKKYDVDLLVCWRYENYRYLSSARNHEWPTMFFIWSAIMTREGDPYIWTMDKDTSVKYMPSMDPDHMLPELRTVETEGPAKLWCAEVKEILKKEGVTPKRIAIDAATIPFMKVLGQEFPDAEIVDAMEIMRHARLIKTEDEVKCMVCAYMLTAAGMERARSLLKVGGVKECELLGEAYREMYKHGSEWVQCSNMVCSGDYTYPYRRLTGDRIIQPRDLVIIDIGGRYNGYYGDFTRTFLAGEDVRATKAQKEIYQKAYDALRRVEKAIKPGATPADLWNAAGEDAVYGNVLGHSIGIGPAEVPVIERQSYKEPMELQPGMVLSIEPFAGRMDVGGVRLEDNFVVTEDGCKVLGPFPHEPRLCDEKPVSEY